MADRMELRAKVEKRQKELELALRVAQGESHPEERINGLKADLRVASDALQGGWDKVSEVAAEELSKWLEATQPMVIPPKAHEIKAHESKPTAPRAKA